MGYGSQNSYASTGSQPQTSGVVQSEQDKQRDAAIKMAFPNVSDADLRQMFPGFGGQGNSGTYGSATQTVPNTTPYGQAKEAGFNNDAPYDRMAALTEAGRKEAQYQLDRGYQMKGAQLGAATTANAAQIGNASTIQGSTIAPAASMNSAQIDNRDAAFRQGQQNLVGDLQAAAAGQGPSLAQDQLNRGTDAAVRSAMAVAASTKAGNSALALRHSLSTQSQIAQGAARDAATLRLQEQIQARNQLSGALGQARGQDIGLSTTQAGLNQNANAANMDAYNQRASQQANLSQNANLANQGALNTNMLQQAGLNQQTNLTNASAMNQNNLTQGAMNQQTAMTNLDAMQRQNNHQDDLMRFYLSLGMTNDQARQAMYQAGAQFDSTNFNAAEDRAVRVRVGDQNAANQAAQNILNPIGAVVGAVGSLGATAITADSKTQGGGGQEYYANPTGPTTMVKSDERKKTLLGSGAQATQNFLQSLGSSQSRTNSGYSGYQPPSGMQGSQGYNGSMNQGMRQQGMQSPGGQYQGGVNYGSGQGDAGGYSQGGGGFSGGYNPGAPGTQGSIARNNPSAPIASPASAGASTGLPSYVTNMPPAVASGPVGFGTPNQAYNDIPPQAPGPVQAAPPASYYAASQPPANPYSNYNNNYSYLMSDERQKNVMGRDDARVSDFLNKLDNHLYTYNNPNEQGAARGLQSGPMAQEIEKSEIGKAAVVDTPNGKMVNTARLTMPMLGGLSMHERRLQSLEQALSKKGK